MLFFGKFTRKHETMVKLQLIENAIEKGSSQNKSKYHKKSKSQIDSWKDNIYGKRFISEYQKT